MSKRLKVKQFSLEYTTYYTNPGNNHLRGGWACYVNDIKVAHLGSLWNAIFVD